MCVPSAHRGQKRVSDVLKLDLQVVLDYRPSAGTTGTLNH